MDFGLSKGVWYLSPSVPSMTKPKKNCWIWSSESFPHQIQNCNVLWVWPFKSLRILVFPSITVFWNLRSALNISLQVPRYLYYPSDTANTDCSSLTHCTKRSIFLCFMFLQQTLSECQKQKLDKFLFIICFEVLIWKF